ncbi:DUF2938 domain-containing protein [Alcaligenes sp. WGS1538]|uniref:DUF2938 domain-containing protein n=1 Tax=Alcaligenes sp. WGS1538 TaxID=3366811 RepID=UPI00372D1C11
MNATWSFLLQSALIGAGATLVMDAWAWLLKRLFGAPSLNYAMVGRWAAHLPRGRLMHESIAKAAPVAGEAVLGWGVHYLVGVVFAAVLLALAGPDWLRAPTFLPALAWGVFTVAAPFLVLQPGMGAGFFASRTPQPSVARLRSLMAHASFGAGLYIAAWLYSRFLA